MKICFSKCDGLKTANALQAAVVGGGAHRSMSVSAQLAAVPMWCTSAVVGTNTKATNYHFFTTGKFWVE